MDGHVGFSLAIHVVPENLIFLEKEKKKKKNKCREGHRMHFATVQNKRRDGHSR